MELKGTKTEKNLWTEIYTLSLHDALPIYLLCQRRQKRGL